MCANCWRQSLKVFCQLRPSYCRITHTCPTLHCQKTLPHLLHIATQTKAPPKNNTYESVLYLQPFIVATISQWVFNDSQKQTIDRKCHSLSSCFPHMGLKVFFWEISRLDDFVFENIFRRPSDHFVPSVPPLASWACPPEKLIKPDKDKTFEFRPLIICLPIQSWAHLSFLLTINHAPRSVLVGWSWNWGKINAKWLIPSPVFAC